jgi:hypothetical protein
LQYSKFVPRADIKKRKGEKQMNLFDRTNFSSLFPAIGRLLSISATFLLLSVPIAVNAQSLAQPGLWIPPVVNLAIRGGTVPGKKFLSVGADGSYADLYEKDDNSGRQRWVFQRSADGVSYNILVDGGAPTNRKYLSVTADGSKVDLFSHDDGSGRQRWKVSEREDGSLVIVINGGVNNNRKFLSTTSDGSKVDLFTGDDNSGRQNWNLIVPPTAKFNVRISGGVTGKMLLSSVRVAGSAFLNSTFNAEDVAEQWRIVRIGKEYSFYQDKFSDTGNFLLGSQTNDAARVGKIKVRLLRVGNGVNNNDSYWKVENIGSGLIRLKLSYATKPMYLSASADGTTVDLFDTDDSSGRQRWKVMLIR